MKKTNRMLKQIATVATVTTLLAGCASTQTSSIATSTTEPETTEVTEVKDTSAPVISLSKGSVGATAGTKLSELELSDNIKSVKDDTDGSLKLVEKLEDGKAGYVIDLSNVKNEDGKLVKGTYSIKVTAQDSAGNETTETFELKVATKETANTTTNKNSTKKSTTTKKNTDTSKKSTTSSKNSANTTKKSTTSNKNTASTSKKDTTSNKSNTTTNKSNNSSSNSGTAAQTHTHSWVAQTKNVHHDAVYNTVHHDATGHYETQTETYETTETHKYYQCFGSGVICYTIEELEAQIASMTCGRHGTVPVEVPVTKTREVQVWVQDSGAYDEQVLVTAAYDETVTTGYKCSTCGATK